MVSDSMYKALVIEDEIMARQELISALNEDGQFAVQGEAQNVSQAYDLVKSTPVDVLFLDIGLPGGNAFYLLSELKKNGVNIPPVIIVTANTEFEYAKKLLNNHSDVVIYILNKPFWSSWIQHCNNIIELLLARSQESREYEKPNPDRFVSIQFGRKSFMVDPTEIVFIQTGNKGKGMTVITLKSNVELNCSLSLSRMLLNLPPFFFQINRFEAINLYCISLIDHGNKEVILENGHYCSIGSAFYDQFLKVTQG